MRKLKLKTDEDGNKTTTVNGIRAACKIMKTRYAKPFESVQVEIPYKTGMSPYSGLIDMLESQGILVKVGNMLQYTSPVTGEISKAFRKNWTDEQLNIIMSEYAKHTPITNKEETEDE